MSRIQNPDPSALSAREQARLHLFTIFPYGFEAGEWLELRCLDTSHKPAAPGPREYYRSVTDLVEAALKHRLHWDVFFGVATRKCSHTYDMRRCGHRQKGTDHVSRLSCAWGDFDVTSPTESKPHPDIASLLNALAGAEAPPQLIVGSGRGVHAYWPLGDATADLDRVEAVNRAIRDRLGADNAVDAARVLRLAGTFSYKYGERLPVRLLRCSHGRD